MQISQDKKEALQIESQLGILNFLSPFGECAITGSVALDLIVKPDIDVHLLTKNDDLFMIIGEVYRFLINKSEIQHVHISDYRINNGFKVGVYNYKGPNKKWSIDIWITHDPKSTGFVLLKKLNDKLTPKQREIILQIKRDYYNRGDLSESLSTAIYYAVFKHDVKNVTQFKQYDIGALLKEGL